MFSKLLLSVPTDLCPKRETYSLKEAGHWLCSQFAWTRIVIQSLQDIPFLPQWIIPNALLSNVLEQQYSRGSRIIHFNEYLMRLCLLKSPTYSRALWQTCLKVLPPQRGVYFSYLYFLTDGIQLRFLLEFIVISRVLILSIQLDFKLDVSLCFYLDFYL